MNLLLIVIIVLAALVLVAALFVVGIYNKLVALRNRFTNAYAQIDVQLKRRYDLIPSTPNAMARRSTFAATTVGKSFSPRPPVLSRRLRLVAAVDNARTL
jgi:hypothetical protein